MPFFLLYFFKKFHQYFKMPKYFMLKVEPIRRPNRIDNYEGTHTQVKRKYVHLAYSRINLSNNWMACGIPTNGAILSCPCNKGLKFYFHSTLISNLLWLCWSIKAHKRFFFSFVIKPKIRAESHFRKICLRSWNRQDSPVPLRTVLLIH